MCLFCARELYHGHFTENNTEVQRDEVIFMPSLLVSTGARVEQFVWGLRHPSLPSDLLGMQSQRAALPFCSRVCL